jgi:hypothetical protein
MEGNIKVTEERVIVPIQIFNGKEYRLYKDENYFSRGRKRLHTEVWKFYKGDIPKGYHVHHVDGNSHNNDISNLNIVLASLHMRFEGKKRFKNNSEWAKEFHAKGIECAKEWHASKEGREWHSEHGKKMWINREYKTKVCQVCSKEYKTRHNGPSKYCHQNCKAAALRARRKLQSGSL